MTAEGSIKVAIIGSGPSGFYAAQALATSGRNCEIDIIERLPTPYGLIRSGVAPDHPNTKTIQSTFEQFLAGEQIRFFGNVTVGSDVNLAELREIYDAVVLATGASLDVRLGIPGEDLPGVYGASAFVGWYNGHPDHADLAPDLTGAGAVIIGNGNVAIDIARILSKPVDDLARTDIADHAIERLATSAVSDIHVVGRRGPVESKFTNVELTEIGEMPHAVALADEEVLHAQVDPELSPRDRRVKEKNLRCFQAFAANDPASRAKRIHFRFHARPVAVLGNGRVEAVRFERTRVAGGRAAGSGDFFDIPCSLLVTAIGYRSERLGQGDGTGQGGRIATGLYSVGWYKRGPSGKIATNRMDGDELAGTLLDEISSGHGAGRQELIARLRARNVDFTDFSGWKIIDAEETRTARPGAPRRKIIRVPDMLGLLGEQA